VSADASTATRDRIGSFFLLLLAFVPASYALAVFSELRTLTFVAATLAIVPLSRIIGFATRQIALQTNPAFGGLVNATFGNAIELFIAVLALRRGLTVVVQASIVGSIVGNILLLTGMSLFLGGLRYKEQRFNKESVGVSSTMLIIAVVGLAIPTVYALTVEPEARQVRFLSDAVAVVLAAIYVAGLIFAFATHRHLFDASDEIRETNEAPTIGRWAAAGILLASTVAVALESEILVSHVEPAALSLGLTQTFIGVVVIAIITNIAEKANAIGFALEDKLDISLEIGLASAIQIALFVVPTLVLISEVCGYRFSLVFSMFEVSAVLLAVMILNHLSADGKCNWLEGAQLISVYAIIAVAFFFI
jgi:Ca2+:H+ antiporter